MAREKKRRIKEDGEISFGGTGKLSVSIAARSGADGEALSRKESEDPASAGASDERQKKETIEDFVGSIQQATLHRESSGRGGKTVTILKTRPEPTAEEALALAKEMRKGLGCGSHVERTSIVLQGDIRERAGEWLTKRGAKKIVEGN